MPRKDVRIAGRQTHFFDGLHGVSGGEIEWIAGTNVGEDADLKFPVVALQARRPGAAPDASDIFKAHLSQFGRRDHHARQHIGIIALLRQQLHGDGILFRAFLEASNLVFAGIKQPDGIADVGHAYADIRGALPVQLHLQLRRIQVEAGIHVYELGILRHPAGDLLAEFRQFT